MLKIELMGNDECTVTVDEGNFSDLFLYFNGYTEWLLTLFDTFDDSDKESLYNGLREAFMLTYDLHEDINRQTSETTNEGGDTMKKSKAKKKGGSKGGKKKC